MYFHNAHQLIKVTETICIKLYQELETINFGGFMAMLVLAIIPIVIFYIASQKYIIKGVISGAVKG